MITYQDFLSAKDKNKFIISSISSYRRSTPYLTALDANEYDAQRNVSIRSFVKLVYDMTGVSAPDTVSANNKIPSNFFHRLNNDRCSYSLGNGVSFAESGVKEKLGKDFDTSLSDAAYLALIHGVSYLFPSKDDYYVFPMTEFLPLPDEETGALRAGIRFWSLDWKKRPAYVTLYEEDGYTKYRSQDGKPGLTKLEEIQPKKAYKEIVQYSEADGEEVVGQENYSQFPIVPVYASRYKESTLVGMRPDIDAYDMIHSGFANDLQDCAQIYWKVSNAMGMEPEDLAKFRDRLIFQHVAVVDDSNSSVDAFTQEIPYNARQACLTSIRNKLYEDFAVLDVHTVAAGATNDHIDAGYQPMDQEADRFEYQMIKVVQQIERIKGMEPYIPQFKRNKISNQVEQVQMVTMEAQWLDDETVLTKLPNITVDEIQNILQKKDYENAQRFNMNDDVEEEEQEQPEEQV